MYYVDLSFAKCQSQPDLFTIPSTLPVLPVSQRCDNQSVGTPKKLILVNEVHISDLDNTVIQIFLEVESALFQPFKVGHAFNVHPYLTKE